MNKQDGRREADAQRIAASAIVAAIAAGRGGGNAAVTSVAWSGTSVTLLTAKPARMGAFFFNDTDKDAYIKLGATASTTDFTMKVAAGASWAVPFLYVGVIDYIGAALGTGSIRCSEFS